MTVRELGLRSLAVLVDVGTDGQRDGAGERSVREFRESVRFAGLGAFGFDRQLPVAHGDFDVLDRVDSGKFRPHLVEAFAGLVPQPQQIVSKNGRRPAIDGKLAKVGKPLKSSDSSGSNGRD